MDFSTNPRDYPQYIFLDTTANPVALFKPYQYIKDDNDVVFIDLIGMVLGQDGESKKTILLSEFTSGRFVPVLSVSQVRALIAQFQSLDSNSLFAGSFPDNSPAIDPQINPVL